jgi:hypothetical protein
MQITKVIFAGAVAALAVLATPALAKNSDSNVPPDAATAATPPCYSYQPKPDGSWTQLPCQELGVAKPPPPRKSAAKTEEDSRKRHAVR